MATYWTSYAQFIHWLKQTSINDKLLGSINPSTPSSSLASTPLPGRLTKLAGPPKKMAIFWALFFLRDARGNRLSVPRSSDRFDAVQIVEEFLTEALPEHKTMTYENLWQYLDILENDLRNCHKINTRQRIWEIFNDGIAILWEFMLGLLVLQWMLI